MGAARDFLELINHKGLPLFNPLVGDSHVVIVEFWVFYKIS